MGGYINRLYFNTKKIQKQNKKEIRLKEGIKNEILEKRDYPEATIIHFQTKTDTPVLCTKTQEMQPTVGYSTHFRVDKPDVPF